MQNILSLWLNYYVLICSVFYINPISPHEEALRATFHRPLLEILHPVNGQVLETSEVEIEIVVRDYILPSPFRDSKLCVGMSAMVGKLNTVHGSLFETCFDQTKNKVFHATGLEPGASYSVRVLLVDRGHVIAVSMRHIRVAAIAIRGNQVTIRTALQAALQLHQTLDRDSAALIYRRILEENPHHEHALHLLGLVIYENGNPREALPYIELALQGNSSFENFHNSMGLCLKDIGRTQQAISHLQLAISLSPDFVEARFNLGNIWQQTGQYDLAVQEFQTILKITLPKKDKEKQLDLYNVQTRDVYVKLCDLYRALSRDTDAIQCFSDALELFPKDAAFLNERGNAFLEVGDLSKAMDDYVIAAKHGQLVSMLNIAVVLESQGNYAESTKQYELLRSTTTDNKLPQGHILILKAMVLPRILPHKESELVKIRNAMNVYIDEAVTFANTETDPTNPVLAGHSTGYYLLSHHFNDRNLKQKIAYMYLTLYPALQTGQFVTMENIIIENSIATSMYQNVVEKHIRPRFGFISNQFETESIGTPFLELLKEFNQDKYDIYLFAISPIQNFTKLQSKSFPLEHIIVLSSDVGQCANEIRKYQLDAIIYPELGTDKNSYFLAFARLAPVQASWFGHPQTTGIPAIDYYITSHYEVETEYQSHYSEKTFLISGLGLYTSPQLPQDMTVTKEYIRDILIREYVLPKSFHFYFVLEPIVLIHPDNDDITKRILELDRLGHIFFIGNSEYWQTHYLLRLEKKIQNKQISTRIHLLHNPTHENILHFISASDVILAPLYANRHHASLMAFSRNIPVVTMPGKLWTTRIPYAFYKQMGFYHCVAKTVAEYIQIAVRIVLDLKFRHKIQQKLQANQYRIFKTRTAVVEWERFFTQVEHDIQVQIQASRQTAQDAMTKDTSTLPLPSSHTDEL